MALATFLSAEDVDFHAPAAALRDGADTPVLEAVAHAHTRGYDVVCLPLTTDKWRERWRRMCISTMGADELGEGAEAEARAEAWRANPVFELGEVTMTRLDEADGVAVMLSDWLELDATDDWVRHDSEIALQQELSYASYLDVHTAILPPPRNRDQIASYGRTINTCLSRTPYMQLSVRLPIYDPSIFRPHASRTSSPASPSFAPEPPSTPSIRTPEPPTTPSTKASEAELNATWEMWDIVRSLCAYSPRLTLTLDLTPPLPSVPGVLNRWAAEPIRHVFLPASTFIANGKGYPVLPKGSQMFIRDIMKHRPIVMLSRAGAGLHAKGGEAAYLQYVRHLEKTSPTVVQAKTPGTVENFARGYQDYLQAPLQPLMDNLQSVTYQTFEQDPVKYQKYEEAVYQALVEWPESEKIVIAVAGAGRGPLVARCLLAIERSKRPALVYAVEKNPNAFVTLQRRKATEWREQVELLFGDMRTIQVPEKADIIVSELLGSFGDNELSPECLDGAMRFLKPEGISIPASYSAYMAPLSSSKLYNEVRAGKDDKATETPYVVMFEAVNILSDHGGGHGRRCGPQVQECWYFEHPRRDAFLNEQGLPPTNSHNTRSAKMTFHIPHAGVLHGLAGYFEATLYGEVGLSIHPQRKDLVSKDMLSWFPIFFPLREPLYLPSNSELQVSIWRLTNQRQVWYEWYAESFLPVYHPLSEKQKSGSPRVDGRGSFAAAAATPFATPSPLIDAIDNPFITAERPVKVKEVTKRAEEVTNIETGVVKIGQTSLHNPGGRSSWIGL
ncbi:PRMT5-domain-containing protein [Auriscalpium vulgare]|uniref:PRMT5-domain-containing protein n=1 Tax=Auriscalpium vulgare TaxID=40419 RepID=A0ACB8S129_9AGAM|nr:PRMT5-domain-containing protein [Auriscalpium vulgare]